jgi:hypothetical protein
MSPLAHTRWAVWGYTNTPIKIPLKVYRSRKLSPQRLSDALVFAVEILYAYVRLAYSDCIFGMVVEF